MKVQVYNPKDLCYNTVGIPGHCQGWFICTCCGEPIPKKDATGCYRASIDISGYLGKVGTVDFFFCDQYCVQVFRAHPGSLDYVNAVVKWELGKEGIVPDPPQR